MSPKDNNKQVSAAVRILQQKRDASARATHLMVKNDSLITYEKAISDQAAVKKFFSATFLERKTMSTKTITKRIALVAVAALAFGGVSVITATSAKAITPTFNTTVAYDTTNSFQVVGGQATIEVGFDSNTIATLTSTGVGSIVSATPVAGQETLTSVTSTGFQFNSNTDGAHFYDTVTVVVTSAVAGTQTLSVVELDANGVPGPAFTRTITWTASGTLAAASWSTFLIDSTTGVGASATIIDSTVPLAKNRGTAGTISQVALVVGRLLDGNRNPVAGATVSVTVAGPGLIGAVADGDGIVAAPTANQRVASVTTVAGGYVVVALSGDGTAGVSTVTLTSGTVSTSRSVTFTGAAASYTVTSLTGTYGVGSFGTNDSLTASGIRVSALDSAGGRATVGNFWATSSNPAVASVSTGSQDLSSTSNGKTAGTGFINVTGVSAGTATITIRNTDPAGTTAPTVSATVAIEVTSGTADSVTMALDKATYQPGEPGVLSITLTNAAGRPVADGTYTIFAAATPLTANLFMQPNSTGANGAFASGVSVTTNGGVAKYDIYAPSVSGDLSFSGTTIAASTVSSALTQKARGLVLAATAAVSGGAADANASLALDAANAATDAANNAYDEAQNATQAASDALAAVTALAAQVKTLIAQVKKLTRAVAKLR
jgi:hypothetical protein